MRRFTNVLAVLAFIIVMLVVAWWLLYVVGCAEHQALRHARLTYPECDVSIVDEDRFYTTVEMRCPHQSSFTKRYRRK